jgi:hypothetical protein
VTENRRRRRRRHRRRNPLAATEARHHRRHRRHHRRRNPISGMREFGMGVFGLALGGFLASTTYRYAVTHALTTTGQDAPAAGQIYNAESPDAPLWRQGWKALAIAALSIVAPFGISSYVKSSSAKSFWQLAGFGGLGFFGVKALNDVAVNLSNRMTTPNPTALRLFAAENMALADLNAANVGTVAAIRAPSAHVMGVAGMPRLGIGAGPPAGWALTHVRSAADCPPGSQYYDLGLDGKWCATPPASPPPSPPQSPPPSPPGGGPPPMPPLSPPPTYPPPMNPPGMCPPGPPSPPSQTVCYPTPPGALTPPYAQSPSGSGGCCDGCARGGRCSCPISSGSDYLSVDMDRA